MIDFLSICLSLDGVSQLTFSPISAGWLSGWFYEASIYRNLFKKNSQFTVFILYLILMRSFPLSFISVYRLMLFPFCVISTNNFIPLNLLICLHTQNLAFILLLQTHLPLWYLFQNHFIVHISGLELEQTLMTMTPQSLVIIIC